MGQKPPVLPDGEQSRYSGGRLSFKHVSRFYLHAIRPEQRNGLIKLCIEQFNADYMVFLTAIRIIVTDFIIGIVHPDLPLIDVHVADRLRS